MKKLSSNSLSFSMILLLCSIGVLTSQAQYQTQHYVHQWPFSNGEYSKQVLFDDHVGTEGIVTLGEVDPIGGVAVSCSGTVFFSPGGVNIMHLTKHDPTNPSVLMWSNTYLPTGTITLNSSIFYEVTDICQRKTGPVAQRGYVICGNITETFANGSTFKSGFLMKTTLIGNVVWFRQYWHGSNIAPVPGSDEIGFNAIVDVPNSGYIVVGYRKIFNAANKQVARMMKVNNLGAPTRTKEVSNNVSGHSEFKDICSVSANCYALIGNCGTQNIPGTIYLADADVLLGSCNATLDLPQYQQIGIIGGGNIETGRSLVFSPALNSLVVVGEKYLQTISPAPALSSGNIMVFSIGYLGGTTFGGIGWSNSYGIPGAVDVHPEQIILSLRQNPPNPNGPNQVWNVIGHKNLSLGIAEPWLLVGEMTGAVHTFQDIPAGIFPGFHLPISLVERPANALWPGFENNIIWYGQTINALGTMTASLVERNINQPPIACAILPLNDSVAQIFPPAVLLPNSNRSTANLLISYSTYCLPLTINKPCLGLLREGDDEIKVTVENDWNVYPNPTADMVNIQLPSNTEGSFTIEVYDISGRMLMTQTTESNSVISVSLSDFDSGVYLIRLIGNENGEVKTFRVIRN